MPETFVRILAPPRWGWRMAAAGLTQLAEHWDLLAVLSRHRIHVRYKQSALGGLWALLQPLAMMVVFTAVFSRLVRVPSDGVPYALFAYSGILPWTFFATAVSNGTNSLVNHASLVSKVFFPREILPLSYVVGALVDLLIGASVLVALLLWYNIPLHGQIITAVPIILVLSVFAFACALGLSVLQVYFRDIGIALPVVLQLWIFATPVLYPLSVVPAPWRTWYGLNPLVGLIDSFRAAVLGMPFDRGMLGLSVAVTLAALPATYLLFKRLEATAADVI